LKSDCLLQFPGRHHDIETEEILAQSKEWVSGCCLEFLFPHVIFQKFGGLV